MRGTVVQWLMLTPDQEVWIQGLFMSLHNTFLGERHL